MKHTTSLTSLILASCHILLSNAIPYPQMTPYLEPVITTHGTTIPLTGLAQSDTESTPSAPVSTQSTAPESTATGSAPTDPSSTDAAPPAATHDTIVYWGLTPDQRPLRDYCASDQGISTLVLAFLTSWGSGSGQSSPSGKIGTCLVGPGSAPCPDLQSDVDYCKSQGVKIFISLGGANQASGLTSDWDAQTTASSLWNSWAAPSASLTNVTAPRPIGSSFVDGFDFDVETNVGNDAALLPKMVSYLRGLFPRDTVNTYLISGAPQCPLPELNMGTAIQEAQFDLLFVQFYNNPLCSAYQATSRSDGGSFNWAAWETFVGAGASKDAKMYLGLPASDMGANGGEDGSHYFLQPDEMQALVVQIQSNANFGGVMLWDAYNSDQATANGCTYAQNVRKVIDDGVVC